MLSDLPDTQSHQKPVEGNGLAAFDGRKQQAGRAVSESLKGKQLWFGQPIQVGERTHERGIHQLRHGLLPEPFDVECALRCEMLDGALELRRTDGLAGAVVVRTLFGNVRAAHGAVIRHSKGLAADLLRYGHPLGDRRNDVARPFHPDGIADTDVLSGHLIGVMKRRSADRDTANFHRDQQCKRGQRAGAPDGDRNVRTFVTSLRGVNLYATAKRGLLDR